MKPYNSFNYLYPPRPEVKIPLTSIPRFDNGQFWAQPKLNGSCAILFTDGEQVIFMNRHKETFARELLLPKEELKQLHRGNGWMVLVGEYMNKSKKDKNNNIFNGKFVIFDMLVYENQHLTKTSFSDRQKLLDTLYEVNPYDGYIEKISPNVFKTVKFINAFSINYSNLTQIDMYEGLVLKRYDALLDDGISSFNNTGWQIKVRKPTKNYQY